MTTGGAFDRLLDLPYPKLRRIARQHLERRRAGENVESAALAKRLVRTGGVGCENGCPSCPA